MLRNRLNRVLALVLVGCIALIGVITTVTSLPELAYAFFKSYVYYLDDDANAMDAMTARIDSLTSAIDTNLFLKKPFQKLNLRVQMALGKQLLTYGGGTMVRLNTGQLYDTVTDYDVTADLDKMSALSQSLKQRGIEMIYVYAHSQLYREGMLPEGVQDYNNKVGDDIVSGLRERGVNTIDSREVMADIDIPLDEIVFRTDHHWNVKTAFYTYAEVVRQLNRSAGMNLDESAADLNNFSAETLEGVHFGQLGQRLDPDMIAPDDFIVLSPNFDTHIRSSLWLSAGVSEREGSFEQAVTMPEYLPQQAGEYANCYDYYGVHTERVAYQNDRAQGGRVLVVKDSFGTPVASFLSLAVSDLLAVDMRKSTDHTIEDYVKEYQPEAVVIVHSQGMMREKNYVFVD